MTTKSISKPVVFSVRGLTPFVLIMLAMLAILAISEYSQAPTGNIVTDGFVDGETFATNGRFILGYREVNAPEQYPATNLKLNLGYRGGVGPAWHHGPKTSIAHPPVAVAGQAIRQASPDANPELSIARRYATEHP